MVMNSLVAGLVLCASLSGTELRAQQSPLGVERCAESVRARPDAGRPSELNLDFARAEQPARGKADRQNKAIEKQALPAPPRERPVEVSEEQRQQVQDQTRTSKTTLPDIASILPYLTGIWALFCVCVYVLVFGGIGYWIGRPKGRGVAGFLFGVFLASFGWIVTGVLTPTIAAEARRQRLVSELLTRRSR